MAPDLEVRPGSSILPVPWLPVPKEPPSSLAAMAPDLEVRPALWNACDELTMQTIMGSDGVKKVMLTRKMVMVVEWNYRDKKVKRERLCSQVLV